MKNVGWLLPSCLGWLLALEHHILRDFSNAKLTHMIYNRFAAQQAKTNSKFNCFHTLALLYIYMYMVTHNQTIQSKTNYRVIR